MRKKIGATSLSLLVTAYCTFGFMASFEGGADPSHVFKVGYAVVGVGCLAGAMMHAIRKPSNG